MRHARQQRLTDSNVKAGIDFFLVGPYTQKDVDLWPFKEEADRTRLRQGLGLAGLPKAGKGKHVSPTEVAGATTVDPAAAKILLNRGVPFVDVRPDARWKDAHIPGAVNIPFDQVAQRIAEIDAPHGVALYCMVGPRARKGESALLAAGYEKIFHLEGGLAAWQAADLPIESTR